MRFLAIILMVCMCHIVAADDTPILSTSLAPSTTASTTAYRPLCDNAVVMTGRGAWGNQVEMWQPIPVPGGVTFSYFMLSAANAPTGSYTFTIMKKSGATVTSTALIVTLSGTNKKALNNTVSVPFAQGDLVCVQCTTGSSAVNMGAVSWCVKATMRSGSSMVLGGLPSGTAGWPSNTKTNYGSFQGCAGNGAGTNGPFECMPTTAMAQNLYVYVPTAVTTGSWKVAVDQNANGTALAATVTSGNTASDTTHTITLSPGDFIGTDMVPTGTPNGQASINWGIELRPSVPGQSIGTYDITGTADVNNYNGLGGGDNAASSSSTTEAQVQNVIFGGVVVKNLYYKVAAIYNLMFTATLSYSTSATLRVNGTNTTVTTSTLPGAFGSDTTHQIVTKDYDLLSTLTVNSGGGYLYPCMGIVFYISPNL